MEHLAFPQPHRGALYRRLCFNELRAAGRLHHPYIVCEGEASERCFLTVQGRVVGPVAVLALDRGTLARTSERSQIAFQSAIIDILSRRLVATTERLARLDGGDGLL